MNKKNNKTVKKSEKVVNNCVLHVTRENGYINFSLDIEEITGVKVRLVVPSVKLATKIYHKINKN